jgi:hypothetical protein
MQQHYLAKGVGHYGVFNGSRFRAEIQPRIADFIAKHHAPSDAGRNRLLRPIRKREADIQSRLEDAFGITALTGGSSAGLHDQDDKPGGKAQPRRRNGASS